MTGPWIVCGTAAAPIPGESVCGDACLVRREAGGVLLAVADGLGHGEHAAKASAAAMETLRATDEVDVIELLARTHAALKDTRGVALSLAWVDGPGASLTWAGVGNVEAVLVRAAFGVEPPREWLSHRGGVVGYQLPHVRASRHALHPGDLLVFATDGVRSGFLDAISLQRPPRDLAEAILGGWARGNDDALVLVGRFTGEA